MSRLLQVFISCVMLLAFGAADLPRPCAGDGMGNPCTIETCACVAACTCMAHCLNRAVEPMASHSASCHVGPSTPGDAGIAHFALPDPRSPVVLPPPLIVGIFALEPDRYRPSGPERLPSRSLSPTEPPPRVTA